MPTTKQHQNGVYVTNGSGGDYTHGQVAKEGKFVGVAVKQAAPGWDGSLAEKDKIVANEEYLLINRGVAEIAGSFSLGAALYITSENELTSEATSNEVQTVTVDATGGTFTLAVAGGVVASAAVVEATKGDVGNDEVQTVTLTGKTGGTFTLSFDDTGSNAQTTSALAWNATGATVQTALRALSNLADTDVTVTGSAGGPYTVTFLDNFAKTDVAMLVADDALLTPKNVTANIAYNASAATVTSALEGTTYVGSGDVAVTKPSAGHYVVTFGGALADTDIAAMTADSASLTGGTHTATIGTETAGAVAETPFGRVVETSAQDRGLPAGRIRVDLDIKSAVTAATF